MTHLEETVGSNVANYRAKRVTPGYVKENGVKTGKQLIDAATGKRVWWAQLTAYPKGSQGGDDAEVFVAVLSDECPIELQYGEKPLVELVDLKLRFESRLSLVCSGIKRISVTKAAK